MLPIHIICIEVKIQVHKIKATPHTKWVMQGIKIRHIGKCYTADPAYGEGLS